MNRDELLHACFGDRDLPEGKRVFQTEEITATEAHVRAIVMLDYRRIILFPITSPGSGVSEAARTVTVAAVMNVCTDSDCRGRGYATDLLKQAHDEAATHHSIEFAALFAGPELQPFFERLGYHHPEGTPEAFMVMPLTRMIPTGSLDEQGAPAIEPVVAEWPEGRVDTRGTW